MADDMDTAWEDARFALLQRIREETVARLDAERIKDLAEAYALLTKVDVPH